MIDSSRRTGRVRYALTLGAVSLLALAGTLVLPGTAGAATTLGASAAERGRYFGTAVAASRLSELGYVTTLNREFNSVTPENEMGWNVLEPSRNSFSYASADQIVNHARGRGMQIRGHALVTPSQVPSWVNGLTGNDLRSAMINHISQVVGRYKGQIRSWDVVNEVLNEDGSQRESVFLRQLGSGWIEEAFVAARRADPDAKLCYNDYNIEDWNRAKTQAAYRMIRQLRAQNVPVDCVGLQSHFDSRSPALSNYRTTLQSFAMPGVEVQITELDIAGSGTTQADNYRRIVQDCLNVAGCTGITVWGVTDKYSSRRGDTPLLFDGSYNKKPAYHAVLSALGGSR